MRHLTPKSLILELLNITGGNAVSVKELIHLGEMFGFKGNAMRVCLARLTKDFLIESDERGYYRMDFAYNAVSRWISEWRLGTKKTKKWDQRWLVVHPSENLSVKKNENLKALELYGFKEGLRHIWIRPNNLRKDLEILREDLRALGLAADAEVFIGQNFKRDLTERWTNYLWPIAELQKQYDHLLDRLQKSYQKCQNMPPDKAMVETFVLGGEIIRQLARDPLLPEEMISSQKFQQLTEAMLDYDLLGRKFWSEKLNLTRQAAPAHLTLIQG